MTLAASDSHNALSYLQGQFISIASACAFVLDDPITECTRNETPLAIPSWSIGKDSGCQGRWRRFSMRAPYLEADISRSGYTNSVPAPMLLLAVYLSSFPTFFVTLMIPGKMATAKAQLSQVMMIPKNQLSRKSCLVKLGTTARTIRPIPIITELFLNCSLGIGLLVHVGATRQTLHESCRTADYSSLGFGSMI